MDLRTFVAIEIPPELKAHIHVSTQRLRDVARSVKWVSEDNLHITLKFLGKTPESVVPQIEDALRSAARGHKAFEMTFAGVGTFPPPKRPPRVVWVDVEAPEELIGLQKDVETALVALGYEAEERRYSPHLTIGRVKQPPRGGLLHREMEGLEETVFGTMQVAGISLMKSTLMPSGAVYERLCSIQLGP